MTVRSASFDRRLTISNHLSPLASHLIQRIRPCFHTRPTGLCTGTSKRSQDWLASLGRASARCPQRRPTSIWRKNREAFALSLMALEEGETEALGKGCNLA